MKNNGRMGILLDQSSSKKLIILSSFYKKNPRQYIIDQIDVLYREYSKQKLSWEGDDE
jgi:hypothetical protein